MASSSPGGERAGGSPRRRFSNSRRGFMPGIRLSTALLPLPGSSLATEQGSGILGGTPGREGYRTTSLRGGASGCLASSAGGDITPQTSYGQGFQPRKTPWRPSPEAGRLSADLLVREEQVQGVMPEGAFIKGGGSGFRVASGWGPGFLRGWCSSPSNPLRAGFSFPVGPPGGPSPEAGRLSAALRAREIRCRSGYRMLPMIKWDLRGEVDPLSAWAPLGGFPLHPHAARRHPGP
jgi:hypothetical protein